jgi:hypothetical protein
LIIGKQWLTAADERGVAASTIRWFFPSSKRPR